MRPKALAIQSYFLDKSALLFYVISTLALVLEKIYFTTMATRRTALKNATKFETVSQQELPSGRKGKHHAIIADILREIESLEDGRALKIPLGELPDSKANIRSALNRAGKARKLDLSTSSDEDYLYIWKPAAS